jgi:hypothetical protein
MTDDPIITKEKFEAYEKIRQSGVTNMFNMSLVSELSYPHITREEVKYIITHYGTLDNLYPEVRKNEYPRKIGLVNLEEYEQKTTK